MATPPHVFVAYNSLDRDYVNKLLEELQRANVPVWSMEDITPGVTFQDEIEEHIKSCAALVPVISVNYSPWVRGEVGLALSSGRPILPITLNGAKPFLEIGDRHAVKIFNGRMPGLKFFAELRRHIDEHAAAVAPVPSGPTVHTIEDITDSSALVRFAW